mmetsp:Transcript_23980/g.66569  ORF Transcript_23980/g.66569 Transcript_23980/m.66569 type:complete len:114 (-) Transcript_23980:1459-1800(-)
MHCASLQHRPGSSTTIVSLQADLPLSYTGLPLLAQLILQEDNAAEAYQYLDRDHQQRTLITGSGTLCNTHDGTIGSPLPTHSQATKVVALSLRSLCALSNLKEFEEPHFRCLY